jgi:hypothetical protein
MPGEGWVFVAAGLVALPALGFLVFSKPKAGSGADLRTGDDRGWGGGGS